MRVLVSELKAGFMLVLEELIEVLTSTETTLPFGSNLRSCSAVQNVRGQTTGLQEATFGWVDELPVPDRANGLERGELCDLCEQFPGDSSFLCSSSFHRWSVDAISDTGPAIHSRVVAVPPLLSLSLCSGAAAFSLADKVCNAHYACWCAKLYTRTLYFPVLLVKT